MGAAGGLEVPGLVFKAQFVRTVHDERTGLTARRTFATTHWRSPVWRASVKRRGWTKVGRWWERERQCGFSGRVVRLRSVRGGEETPCGDGVRGVRESGRLKKKHNWGAVCEIANYW